MKTLSQMLKESLIEDSELNEAKLVNVYAGFAIGPDMVGMANATGCTFCEIGCPEKLAKVLNGLKYNISTRARLSNEWMKLMKPSEKKAFDEWIEICRGALMGDVISSNQKIQLIWFNSAGVPKR